MKKKFVMALILWMCSMTLPDRIQAQGGGCAFITFTAEHFEPCKYRLQSDNSNECYSGLRILLSEGSYISWEANAPQGWTATLISPTELQLTHTSGIIPIGISIPIDFSIPPGISPLLSVLWDYTCPTEEGCAVDLPLEGCQVIADGCIEGFIYMECDELPFINQDVLSDWKVELLDDLGNVLGSEVTGSDGAYSFCDLLAGNYVVRVGGKPGWTARVPASGQSTIELSDSQQVERNFGVCQNCFCAAPSFTDLILHWDNGPGLSIQCETSYEGIPCPEPGSGYFLTGKFECEGDSCEMNPYVSWELNGPTGLHFNSVQASPYFGINVPPSYTSTNGIYTMTLTSFCGTDTCTCEFQFVVECDTLCPCDAETIHALSLAVNQGFATSASSTGCTVCFAPVALSDCETVDWYLNNPNGTFLGSSIGNQTFCYSFTGPGTYTVVMVVTRLKPDGILCESFVKYKTVTVTCVVNPACDGSVLRNSSFSEGAVSGGFNSGGASEGWTSIIKELEVVEGQSGSLEGWSISMLGNLDDAGVLTSIDPVCLKRDTGFITLRLMTEPVPGLPLIPGISKAIAIYGTLGNSFEIGHCGEENCLHIATISMEEYIPGEWYDITIPYDFRNWHPGDSCGAGVLVRPAVFVTNDINTSQGGEETYSYAQIDNFCWEGLIVAVDQPTQRSAIRLYPNPTNGDLSIELSFPASSKIKMRVASMEGQILLEKDAESAVSLQSIKTDDLPQGIFFLQLVSDRRVLSVHKFVKQ